MMLAIGPFRDRPVRLIANRPLPAYAYLPGGRFPHPVRDPQGHSYGEAASEVTDPSLASADFRWGADLFNHGYYWEAHEAWEPLWRVAARGDPRRALLKGLILMAASGVKIREGKPIAAGKHAGRAATLFRQVAAGAPTMAGLDLTPAYLARRAEAVVERPPTRRAQADTVESVFGFVLTPDDVE